MEDFVVTANGSRRSHINAKLMVTLECLLEPKSTNPEDVGNIKLSFRPTDAQLKPLLL
jgi:hypothetical protein